MKDINVQAFRGTQMVAKGVKNSLHIHRCSSFCGLPFVQRTLAVACDLEKLNFLQFLFMH